MEEKVAGKERRGRCHRDIQESWMTTPKCDFRLTAWFLVHGVWDCNESNGNVHQATRKVEIDSLRRQNWGFFHSLDFIHTKVQFGVVVKIN